MKLIDTFINDWRAKRTDERVYLAKLRKKYEQSLNIVNSPEQAMKLVDAATFGKQLRVTNPFYGYYDQENRYPVHVWVYACVNVIAEKSSVPQLVLKMKGSHEERNADFLPEMPNEVNTWEEIDQLIAMWLELTGNAYLYHDKNDNTFWPLRPSRMKICIGEKRRAVLGYGYYIGGAPQGGNYTEPRFEKEWQYDNPELLYATKSDFVKKMQKCRQYVTKGILQQSQADVSDNWIPFMPDEILHFRYVSPIHDYYGIAPLCTLMKGLDTDLYAREWNLKFFENGAIPPGMVMIPDVLPEAQLERMEKQFDKKYGGTKNKGKTIFTTGGASYTPFPTNHQDFEFLEGQRWNRDEVLTTFGVPHIMVHARVSNTTNDSLRSPGIKEEKKGFWHDTIKPKQKMKAAVWTKHFKPELQNGWMLGYNYDDIDELKPDYETLAPIAAEALRGGMTITEVRENILMLPPEWEGDLWIPQNLVPIQYGNTHEIMVAERPKQDES